MLDEPTFDVTLCAEAVVISNADGTPTGYVRCAGEAADRVGPAACEAVHRVRACEADDDGLDGTCTRDEDCRERRFGACAGPGQFGSSCHCVYACESDADCDAGEVCVCDAVHRAGSRCVSAGCMDASDCDTGRCGAAAFNSGCGLAQGVVCRTDADTCGGNADCPPDDRKMGCGASPAGR